ncbi:hypothetical protein [Branchiibius sp. NY16-3462-2]|uniref:COG4705 family protein n=1 Tax=Branchiibius sp. NY16-3462-2 TaxID=1807500 RepID=UPI000797C5C2|nr:hypothetical protein [Branchiibius sp. NY16-3462-2]KYH43122.1 hypothetical protein AZH51_01340 [Branchiibius sp. NY16-3462-2]
MSTALVNPRRRALKVPEVTLVFWVLKLLSTAGGEAASDYLGSISIAVAGAVGVGLMVITGWMQFRAHRYEPATYWAFVAAIAIFGTMAADAMHVVLDLPYQLTTCLYVIIVAAVLAAWKRWEGSISIHTVTAGAPERFYWATVLATFALGTAAGDLAAFTLKLGYLDSALLFAILFAIPAIAWKLWGRAEVALFWSAYVLTRPLGASVADWLGKPPRKAGGLGWGDGVVTLGLFVAFGAILAVQSRHSDQPHVLAVSAVEDEPA